MVRFSGSANSNMLSKLSREPSELRWQPNLDKNKPKWHKFQFYEEFVEYMGGFTRMVKIQMCYLNFQGSQGSCHANQIIGKSKQKFYRFLICTRYNGDNVRVYGRVFRVGKFKYANKNLNGAQ